MTERTFRVERNGILMFETNLNPGDGVYLSNAVDTYVASIGASAPEVEEVVGEMQVEYDEAELEAAIVAVVEEVTEEELEADDEEASYEEWTVEELKDALRSRSLMVSGTKAELVERLEGDDEVMEDE